VKREKLRVEHEKNLVEIRLRQIEEVENKRMQEEQDREQQFIHVHRQYEEEKEQVRLLKDAMII
jgi:hypothetical protein